MRYRTPTARCDGSIGMVPSVGARERRPAAEEDKMNARHRAIFVSDRTSAVIPRLRSSGIVSAGVLLCAVMLAGCSGSQSSGPAELKIGFMSMLTGPEAEYGQAMKRAVDVAVEAVNSQGGLEVGGKKYKIQVVAGDEETRQTTERAAAATERLIEQDKVLGIVGYVSSSSVLASIPIAQRSKVVALNAVGKAGSIPEKIAKDKMDYIFQVGPYNGTIVASHGRMLANYVKPKKISMFILNSDAPRDYERRARAQWPADLPGVEFQSLFVEPDRLDFQPEILKAKQFQPDLIYAQLSGANCYALADQLAASGVTKGRVVFGDSDWGDPAFLQKTGPKTNLQLAHAVTFEAPITPLTVPFFDGYKGKYNVGPPYYAVQTYDAALLLFEGIRRAGLVTGKLAEDRAAIKAGLDKITKEAPVTGARGNLYFTPLAEGHAVPTDLAVVQFQSGNRVLVWPLGPGVGKFVDPRG
jgi:branched-chain amino acid transport system substrate-binding protein